MPKFKFGATSLRRLSECAYPLQILAKRVMDLQLMDFTVLVGHRDQDAQEEAYMSGASKLHWPNSRHNTMPSEAMDLAPWPIRWGDDGPTKVKDIGQFYRLAGIVLAVAKEYEIPIRWGGDWNMDGNVYDQKFDDLVHFELLHR